MISDPDVYDVLGKEIVHADLETVFFNAFDILNFVKEGIPYKGSSEYMIRDRSRNSKKKLDHILFSIEAKKGFYTWYTTLGTILQMAVYMGFHEIYLIGADCNYQKEQHHAEGTNYNCRPWPDAGAKAIRDYKLAVPILEDLGVKVLNATRGGALEVFPRVNIDEILL